jgi:hypothetical protein
MRMRRGRAGPAVAPETAAPSQCNPLETAGFHDACVFKDTFAKEPAMSQALPHPLTDLPRDGTLRIADGRAHVLAVFEGQVWLTHDGDLRDVFLEAGDSVSFESAGVTLVQAMRDARLLVSDPMALGPTHRIDALAMQQRARELRDAALAALIARGVAGIEAALLRAGRRVRAMASALVQRPRFI